MRKRFFFCMALVTVFLVGLPHAAAQDGQKCLEKGGEWDETTQECRVTAAVEIDIDYPMFVTQYGFAEQAVDEFLQIARAFVLEPLSGPYLWYSPGPFSLLVGYETFQFSPDITSLKFDIYTYTGGAHGMSSFQTYVFDLAGERILALDDLFLPGSDPLAAIAPLVQQDLQTQLGDMTDADWIMEGTAPDPVNYQFFVILPDSLVFYFPPYQVASYSAGPQMVSIPLSTLSGILAPPFGG
jgi:hypothetical protein